MDLKIAQAQALPVSGCGGKAGPGITPVVLTVTVNCGPVELVQGGTDLTPVVIVAPTETAQFAMSDLPAGVACSYKESESIPSGQLTLTANSVATRAQRCRRSR